MNTTELKHGTRKKNTGSQTVQPIRDKKMILKMKELLYSKRDRNGLLFTMGINVGLRISDLLQLTVADVRDRSHILLVEKKTGKAKRFLINPMLRLELDRYTEEMNDEEYLFCSNKGTNKPMSRVQAYRIINTAGSKLGLEEIGTHTLRKTFGYHHYQQFKDVAILQDIFNHAAPSVTLRYIGITDDNKDETIMNFYI